MIRVERNDTAAMGILEANAVFPDRGTFMGAIFIRDGHIIGAAGVDAMLVGEPIFYGRGDASVHAVGKGWTKLSLGKFFGWIFDEMKFKRITSQVTVSNDKSIRFTEGLGFAREGIRRGAGINGEDSIMFGCLASDYRFRRH